MVRPAFVKSATEYRHVCFYTTYDLAASSFDKRILELIDDSYTEFKFYGIDGPSAMGKSWMFTATKDDEHYPNEIIYASVRLTSDVLHACVESTKLYTTYKDANYFNDKDEDYIKEFNDESY